MDLYLRPVLLSSLIVILLNTVFYLPVAPLFTYFLGGILVVVFYKGELKEKEIEKEIRAGELSVLGLMAGSVIGSVLAFIMAIRLKEPELRESIINAINEAMKMSTTSDLQVINELGPSFMIITALMTIFMCSLITLFGSLATLPFLNQKNA